tara:strand:+ start:8161 stop:8325 length:165 start_codon:yes stop_codon:yes gene_type:complete
MDLKVGSDEWIKEKREWEEEQMFRARMKKYSKKELIEKMVTMRILIKDLVEGWD